MVEANIKKQNSHEQITFLKTQIGLPLIGTRVNLHKDGIKVSLDFPECVVEVPIETFHVSRIIERIPTSEEVVEKFRKKPR